MVDSAKAIIRGHKSRRFLRSLATSSTLDRGLVSCAPGLEKKKKKQAEKEAAASKAGKTCSINTLFFGHLGPKTKSVCTARPHPEVRRIDDLMCEPLL